jgi:hypothetical protein
LWEYYGFETAAQQQEKLKLVKSEFLKRTGLQYNDLVSLLQTRYINPNYPQGLSLTIMQSLRFSYRFLQTMVDTGSTDSKERFKKLVAFLQTCQAFIETFKFWFNYKKGGDLDFGDVIEASTIEKWVHCCFEKIGKLIVLESGDGFYFPLAGDIRLRPRLRKSPKAITGPRMAAVMESIAVRYGVEWKFCSKAQTGRRIIEILSK